MGKTEEYEVDPAFTRDDDLDEHLLDIAQYQVYQAFIFLLYYYKKLHLQLLQTDMFQLLIFL